MLGILLTILKVIGWLILGIIGLLLFLICLVLFMPVPYRIWVSGTPENDPVFCCKVKIFGIQVFPGKKRRKRKKDSAGTTDIPEETKCENQDGNAAGQPVHPAEKPVPESAEPSTRKMETAAATGQQASLSGQAEQPDSSDRAEKRFSKDVMGTAKQIWSELTDEHNRRAFLHVLREVKSLLHHIGPRRVQGDVAFSLGDPANTGYLTAVLSVCPFAYGKKCSIEPDFVTEDLYLKGWLDVRGHVCLIHAAASGMRLLFDSDIRRMIKKLRR